MMLGSLAKNRKGHQKWILRVQRKFLAGNYFWEKTIIIFGNAAEIAGTFNWIICHGCQIFPPRVQKKKLLREQKLGRKEYSILFSSLREKVSNFCKSFQQSLQNFVLPIQSINSRKNYSWKVMYLRGFYDVEQHVSDFFAKSILLKFSKIIFTCSKLYFGSNFCLKSGLQIPDFKQKRLASNVKNIRERCQNYMPRVHTILLENNVFRITYQFLSFWTLSVNVLDVFRIFFGWFIKTGFYRFRGNF